MGKYQDKEIKEHLKSIVLSMPEKPGSYQFYDKEGTIIYVGKAKRLKSRVSSYFHTEVDRYKTKLLVSKIQDISYTVVKTEEDALLLENSLIKKYNPKYNILLKDGKTYPSICVTNELLPRIIKTRNIKKGSGTYFGPYSHISTMYGLLEVIQKMYKPRTCYHHFTLDDIEKKRIKPCLEYHIHKCNAPCVGKESIADYRSKVEQIKEILKGNTRAICNHLCDEMEEKAAKLEFEAAEQIKQQYILLQNYVAKSEVVSHTINDLDVFSITDETNENITFINYIHVKNGTINQSFTYEYKRKLEESNEDILLAAIPEIRERFESKAKEVVIPFPLEWKLADAEFLIPQRGDKKRLLELSIMNGKQYKFDRTKRLDKLNPEQKQTRLMKELQEKLKLEKLPYHIECFDNSNISGTNAVAACVVFKAMKPCKKEYRKYNIRTVTGPDDYASMQEAVYRRYHRMLEEGEPLPDLIIADGGIGQMNAMKEVTEDLLHTHIPVAGLAKDNRHRTNELLFGNPPQVIGLKTNSELFHVLTQIQDEVHRFAITFHRDKRSRAALHSELDEIKGIGQKTKELLLREMKSVKAIKLSDYQTLVNKIGKNKADILWKHFHPEIPQSENTESGN